MDWSVTGSVQLLDVRPPPGTRPPDPKPPADPPTETPVVLEPAGRVFNDERVQGASYQADERLSCVVATRPGQPARVKMKVLLDIRQLEIAGSSFNAEREVVEGVDTVFAREVNEKGWSIYFRMNFALKWEEIPW